MSRHNVIRRYGSARAVQTFAQDFAHDLGAGAVSAAVTPYLKAVGCGSRKPNIVVLFADDVGYGDLSCCGHPTIQTPNLDRLAAGGMRLTSFYSAPSCVPACTQLMLGVYPPRVNLGGTGSGGKGGIPADRVTLAQALKKRAIEPA